MDGQSIDKGFFLVFLPVPSFIAGPVKNLISRNQNIELVNDSSQADYMLFISYGKNEKTKKPEYTVYFYSPQILSDIYFGGLFPRYQMQEPKIALTGPSLQSLIKRINDQSKLWIRAKTTAWMNKYERR
jgi:hypothetical protein